MIVFPAHGTERAVDVISKHTKNDGLQGVMVPVIWRGMASPQFTLFGIFGDDFVLEILAWGNMVEGDPVAEILD